MTTRWPLVELQTSVHPLAAMRPVVVQGGRDSVDCLVPNQENHWPNQLAESKLKEQEKRTEKKNKVNTVASLISDLARKMPQNLTARRPTLIVICRNQKMNQTRHHQLEHTVRT